MAIEAMPLVVDGSRLFVVSLAVMLALVHLLADELPLFELVRREYVLSAASGVSTVYVFAHLLPELDARATAIEGAAILTTTVQAYHVTSIAFVGFALFFGLERLAQVSKRYGIGDGSSAFPVEPVFGVRVGAFCIYNAFIGYVLVVGEIDTGATAFAVAMGLHLFGNDEGMRHHHREAYHRFGRWVLATAVLVGAGVGFVIAIGEAILVVLLALLTGGIVFNAIKEELPEDRESSFWAFAVGSGSYALVLALIL